MEGIRSELDDVDKGKGGGAIGPGVGDVVEITAFCCIGLAYGSGLSPATLNPVDEALCAEFVAGNSGVGRLSSSSSSLW